MAPEFPSLAHLVMRIPSAFRHVALVLTSNFLASISAQILFSCFICFIFLFFFLCLSTPGRPSPPVNTVLQSNWNNCEERGPCTQGRAKSSQWHLSGEELRSVYEERRVYVLKVWVIHCKHCLPAVFSLRIALFLFRLTKNNWIEFQKICVLIPGLYYPTKNSPDDPSSLPELFLHSPHPSQSVWPLA